MPEELTDEAGEIVWECSYQLWGKPIQEIAHIEIQQNLRYQGQYLDRETGLHYNTFRYYDPDIGRFTQPDPIGLAGGLNLYQYAPNGLTWIDPWGWAYHKHHSDPKFMGGNKKQKLTTLDEQTHRELHKDLNDFLVKKTKDVRGKDVHMRPQRGNSRYDIWDNFTREERLQALAEFYKGPGAKYGDVAEDFFKQHPELR